MKLKKFHIDRFIKTKKNESEIVDSLKEFSCKKLESGNKKINIIGIVFYDFYCCLSDSKVKLTAKPKKYLLIFFLAFFVIWIIGSIYQHGILFGLTTGIFGILLFTYGHKRLMELSLDEISELIKK